MIETIQTLQVNRNGQPDEAYYAEQRKTEQVAALQEFGHQALRVALRTPLVAGKMAVWFLNPNRTY